MSLMAMNHVLRGPIPFEEKEKKKEKVKDPMTH
jgi:hypothetical protein